MHQAGDREHLKRRRKREPGPDHGDLPDSDASKQAVMREAPRGGREHQPPRTLHPAKPSLKNRGRTKILDAKVGLHRLGPQEHWGHLPAGPRASGNDAGGSVDPQLQGRQLWR